MEQTIYQLNSLVAGKNWSRITINWQYDRDLYTLNSMKIRFSVNNQWYYFYGHYTPSNGVTVGFIGSGN